MLEYPAKIKHNRTENVYEVSFPDLKGCHTYGDTLDDAKTFAKDALSGWLEVAFEENMIIPEPSKNSGKNIYFISPEHNVSFAILLRKERESRHLSQKQIAEKLLISYQAYQRIENPRKANPTLKTIAKVEKILGKTLVSI
jgi:antitoxin HicB